jgi:protein-S-isoprenylcysteine O-methyltransferase Ste14
MFQSYPGRLPGLHRHAQRDPLAHTTRLSWLAAVVVAATVGLLASAAAIPAAFAQQTQATVHPAAAGGGLTSWQIALIGVGVPLALVAVAVLVRRARTARRAAPSPDLPARVAHHDPS